MRLTDGSGRSLALNRKLGSGGEGAVYEIQGSPDVAKIYNHPIDSEKTAKLRAMVQACSSDLLKIAAWPQDVVHQDGRVCGVVMPRVTGPDIHQLYSPAQRKTVFPRADWAFLLQAARNTAAAVQAIHQHGHIIGDVNQGNLKVSDRATVTLIDCDSFQVRWNGHVFKCEVGVPEFTPPELQGVKSFATVARTANHDNFGLAVLIFHLLFMGRHPFVGRFLGNGDMPVDKAIREFRFAFGPYAASNKMTPPPFALPLEAASGLLASFFLRAFSAKSAQGGRPSAKEWVQGLDDLRQNLRRCVEGHSYPSMISTCPWCEFENQGQFFFISFHPSPTGAFDSQRVRNAIDSARLGDLSISYTVSSTRLPPPSLTTYRRSMRIGVDLASVSVIASAIAAVAGVSILVVLVCAMTWLVLLTVTPYGRNVWHLRFKAVSLLRKMRQCQNRFENEHKMRRAAVVRKIDELKGILTQHAKMISDCNQEKQKLQSDKREHQLRQFLIMFVIENAGIKNIGPARCATLRSWNIETAADVTRQKIAAVPGFGPMLTDAIFSWRKGIERKFVFNPNQAVSPAEIALIDQKYLRKRRDLESILTAGVEQLSKTRSRDEVEARACTNEIQGLVLEHARIKSETRAYRCW